MSCHLKHYVHLLTNQNAVFSTAILGCLYGMVACLVRFPVEMSSPRSGGVRADMSVRWSYADLPAAKCVIGCSSYLFSRR